MSEPNLQFLNAPANGSLLGNFASGPFVLRLSNLPSDLLLREATAVFALVTDDILSVDLRDYKITAHFKTLNACLATGKVLDGKYIFGPDFGPVSVDYENNPMTSPASHPVASATNQFGTLRLSNTSISPPSISNLAHTAPAPPTSHQGPPPSSLASNAPSNGASGPPQQGQPFDAYQKRQLVGNQRLRFLFSDPFSGLATPTASASSQQAPGPAGIDLTDLTGKSLLLMELHNDAREYETLVRDPWGSQTLTSIALGLAPQTPGISGPNPFDWQQQTSGAPPAQNAGANAGGANAANADRRRTSSAFFTNGLQPMHPQLPHQQSTASILSQQPNGAALMPPLGLHPAPASQQPSASTQASQQPAQPPLKPAQSTSSGPVVAPTQTGETLPTTASSQRQFGKDMPDLLLLAKVPPPANPADQNPPCNTLYVGNLPPDATETELRTLFSPQKGFRRLSFRTKNQSLANPSSTSHNHGPMCFVEFEDVAHATRALAELYGRALPRPNGSNGKGGIRLSFSKNPLGVRGPGNPRRTSTNQLGSSSAAPSAPQAGLQPNPPLASTANGNGVGNYGYLNFHGK